MGRKARTWLEFPASYVDTLEALISGAPEVRHEMATISDAQAVRRDYYRFFLSLDDEMDEGKPHAQAVYLQAAARSVWIKLEGKTVVLAVRPLCTMDTAKFLRSDLRATEKVKSEVAEAVNRIKSEE